MSMVINIGEKQDPSQTLNSEHTHSLENPNLIVYAELIDYNQLISSSVHVDNREFYFVEFEVNDYNTELMIQDIDNYLFEIVLRKIGRDGTSYVDDKCGITKEVYLGLRNLANVGYKYKYHKVLSENSDDYWYVYAYYDNNGNIHPWVRIEAKFYSKNGTYPILPFKINKAIVEGDKDNSDEDKQFILDLWAKQYSRIDKRDILRV